MDTINYIQKRLNIDFNSPRKLHEVHYLGRKELARIFGELNFETGVEVGVYYGAFSEVLCESIPQLTLYGVDPWEHYEGYGDFAKFSRDEMMESVKEKMKPYDFIMIEKYSMDAVREFPDNYLDFVYIDANHDDPFVTEDIREWYKKIRVGGILSGHDYASLVNHKGVKRWAVKEAVNKFIEENKIKTWFTTGIKDPVVRLEDGYRSWAIIKI